MLLGVRLFVSIGVMHRFCHCAQVGISSNLASTVCDQEAEFRQSKSMSAPVTNRPAAPNLKCGWFERAKGAGGDGAKFTFKSCNKTSESESGFKGRIVGGTTALPNQYPSAVLFTYDSAGNGEFGQICGGVIVSREWILTAAHCIIHADHRRYGIIAGKHNIAWIEDFQQLAFATKIVKSPQYDANTYLGDIALMQVSPPLNWSLEVLPARLPRPDYRVAGEIMVVGWGRLKEEGTVGPVLQEVQIPVVDDAKCKTLLEGKATVSEATLCAGVPEGGKDACQGDSGGPAYELKRSRQLLVGIVSNGVGCARPELPGVYTEVAYFMSWILETVGKENVKLFKPEGY